MSLDTESKSFWDQSDVESELKRVFEICYGCRRCYNLWPSFNDLFERLDRDAIDGEAEKLNFADLAERLLRDIREGKPALTVSDCALAGLQIQQGTQKKPLEDANL